MMFRALDGAKKTRKPFLLILNHTECLPEANSCILECSYALNNDVSRPDTVSKYLISSLEYCYLEHMNALSMICR